MRAEGRGAGAARQRPTRQPAKAPLRTSNARQTRASADKVSLVEERGETGDMALRLLPAVATVISPIILIRCLMAICNERGWGMRGVGGQRGRKGKRARTRARAHARRHLKRSGKKTADTDMAARIGAAQARTRADTCGQKEIPGREGGRIDGAAVHAARWQHPLLPFLPASPPVDPVSQAQ